MPDEMVSGKGKYLFMKALQERDTLLSFTPVYVVTVIKKKIFYNVCDNFL